MKFSQEIAVPCRPGLGYPHVFCFRKGGGNPSLIFLLSLRLAHGEGDVPALSFARPLGATRSANTGSVLMGSDRLASSYLVYLLFSNFP